MIRRINLLGASGCGKSTMAAWLFAKMKTAGYNIEHVQECVKVQAIEGRLPVSYDQIFLFAQQLHNEDIILRNGIDLIITDCALFLYACYARLYQTPGWTNLFRLAREFENTYPSINFYIRPTENDYKHKGRFQSKEEALEADQIIYRELDNQDITNIKISRSENQKALSEIYRSFGLSET